MSYEPREILRHILTEVDFLVEVRATLTRQILDEDPTVDLVVRGEGEVTFAEVVSWCAAGSPADGLARIPGLAYRENGLAVSTPPRAFVPDLDSLEPAFDLVDWPRYFYRPRPDGRLAIVSSSRGCRQRCSFCSQQKFWERSWRGRTPESFVVELEMLRDRFGVRVAMLSDETPTVDPARWEQILDLLIERKTGMELLLETRVDDILRDEPILPKYRAAGVSHIYVGVESTRQATLDLYLKDVKVESSRRAIELINAHEMVSETSFVLGTPDETVESIRETLELAKWYGPDMAFFLAITPWPYADLHDDLKDYVATRDYRKYNLVEPVVKPTAMPIDEVREMLFAGFREFYTHKMHQMASMPAWKLEFMKTLMHLFMEHSYLKDQMKALAHPHAEVAALRAAG